MLHKLRFFDEMKIFYNRSFLSCRTTALSNECHLYTLFSSRDGSQRSSTMLPYLLLPLLIQKLRDTTRLLLLNITARPGEFTAKGVYYNVSARR